MTNEEFKAWRERFFSSRAAAATYLDLSRDTIDALETGQTRNGAPYPVRHHIALACLAISTGRALIPQEYAASGARTVAAPGRSMTEQTRAIIERADGSRTVSEIAAELKIDRKAVYAAVDRARRNGRDVSTKLDPAAPKLSRRA